MVGSDPFFLRTGMLHVLFKVIFIWMGDVVLGGTSSTVHPLPHWGPFAKQQPSLPLSLAHSIGWLLQCLRWSFGLLPFLSFKLPHARDLLETFFVCPLKVSEKWDMVKTAALFLPGYYTTVPSNLAPLPTHPMFLWLISSSMGEACIMLKVHSVSLILGLHLNLSQELLLQACYL